MAISLIKDALSDFTDQMTLTSLAALTLLVFLCAILGSIVTRLAGPSQTLAPPPPPPAERYSSRRRRRSDYDSDDDGPGREYRRLGSRKNPK